MPEPEKYLPPYQPPNLPDSNDTIISMMYGVKLIGWNNGVRSEEGDRPATVRCRGGMGWVRHPRTAEACYSDETGLGERMDLDFPKVLSPEYLDQHADVLDSWVADGTPLLFIWCGGMFVVHLMNPETGYRVTFENEEPEAIDIAEAYGYPTAPGVPDPSEIGTAFNRTTLTYFEIDSDKLSFMVAGGNGWRRNPFNGRPNRLSSKSTSAFDMTTPDGFGEERTALMDRWLNERVAIDLLWSNDEADIYLVDRHTNETIHFEVDPDEHVTESIS